MYIERVTTNVPGLPVRISPADSPTDRMTTCPIHIHDDIEILAQTGGCMHVFIDDALIPLHTGDIIVINRRVPHSTTQVEPYTTNILLQFRTERLRAGEFENINKYLSFILADNEQKYTFLPHDRPQCAELFDLIRRLQQENIERRDNYDLIIKGYMDVLLGLLYRAGALYRLEDGYDKDAVKKVWPLIEYIDRHYAAPIALGELADLLHLNREYVCRLFKAATHMPPIEYINYVRILKAETLLTTTRKSILEIAMEVGFSSPSYFNRVFKKYKGISPSAYKSITYAKGKFI